MLKTNLSLTLLIIWRLDSCNFWNKKASKYLHPGLEVNIV
jgi:hypothetical protein